MLTHEERMLLSDVAFGDGWFIRQSLRDAIKSAVTSISNLKTNQVEKDNTICYLKAENERLTTRCNSVAFIQDEVATLRERLKQAQQQLNKLTSELHQVSADRDAQSCLAQNHALALDRIQEVLNS